MTVKNWFRFVLGLAQMIGATMSLTFLVKTGLSPFFWSALAVTTLFTLVSRILFWRGKGWQPFWNTNKTGS